MDGAGLPCDARDVVPPFAALGRLNCAPHSKALSRCTDVGIRRHVGPVTRIKRGRRAMRAAPAPDFRRLPLRVDAEGKAPTEINNVKDLPLEPAMGVERLVIEVERLKPDVEMAVDVVAGAEVRLCSCDGEAADRGAVRGICVAALPESNGCAALVAVRSASGSKACRNKMSDPPSNAPKTWVMTDQQHRRTPLAGRMMAPEFKW
jgi:hypothetical protein